MDPLMLSLLAGVAVVALVLGVLSTLSGTGGEHAEKRLDQLTGRAKPKKDPAQGILLRPNNLNLGAGKNWLPNVELLEEVYEQADVGMELRRFLLIPVVLLMAGIAIGAYLGLAWWVFIPGSIAMAGVPFMWLVMRKRKRIKQFIAQMPEALELVGRALRAGHSLASGMNVVAEEMGSPLGDEFGRVFEEQNLGIPIEESLRGLAQRVPAMDVRFFVTAVVIQRATGGDLAEILDKIGRLIRERFQILGQVQALTAEGRLSGVVLLALPPSLLAVTYLLNPDYIRVLFTTTAGTKLLAGAAVLQGIGALAIKKIITIKV